jgi:hypothetical protein
MPDKMSDRMPEDLPVTKCINLMVGITRSKVFFLNGGASGKCLQKNYGKIHHRNS